MVATDGISASMSAVELAKSNRYRIENRCSRRAGRNPPTPQAMMRDGGSHKIVAHEQGKEVAKEKDCARPPVLCTLFPPSPTRYI
jgi:hypothetical protein